MTDFSVAIKIDASQADAALRKVGGELDRVERATKQAEATIKKAVSEGTLHWTKAAEAQKALVGELVRVERAAERAAQQMSGGLNSVLDTVNSKVRQLTQFTGELGLAGNAIGGLVGGIASAASGFC